MRHYEIVFLVHPDQSEEVPAMIERFSAMVTDAKGKVHRVEDWGRRQLAYMIKDVHKAHYAMMNVEVGLDALKEIETSFKFNDAIIRNLIVSKKNAISDPSPLAKTEDDDKATTDKVAAAKKETKPEAKEDSAKAETKPEAKEDSAKAETKPEAKEATAKAETKPEAKEDSAKAETKPEAKEETAKAETKSETVEDTPSKDAKTDEGAE